MAGGRNHIPAHALNLREVPLPRVIDDPRLLHHHHIEDRISARHRDIQSLLLDNQRLAATHVALKQELSSAQHDLRYLSSTASTVKTEASAQVRDVYERSLKLEAQLRSIDGFNSELSQVKADVQKLTSDRKELVAKLQTLDDDLLKERAHLHQLPAIKADIDSMHQEIQRGRAAVEYEKKMHANSLEQSQAMEKNMISMAREIEKLRAELANAEKRARASAAAAAAAAPGPGYAAGYGNSEMHYSGNSYPEPYAMHQVQGAADAGPQYGPGAIPHGPYDMQPHAHR